MLGTLNPRIVAITGASAGIGRATAVAFARRGWRVALLARGEDGLRGTIVQVGSALAYRSIPLQSAYCGAKSALRGFTDSLRSELIHQHSGVHLTMVHLSAFNTPQFDWSRTCMTRQPQPLGRIFQPEVAAESIYWAALHRRRELWVGLPAVEAIIGTRVLPGFLDHKLAHQAYDGQHTDEAIAPDRRDNLYQPVPGDHGIHGRFDRRAVSHSAEVWAATHRQSVIAGVLAVLVAAGKAWARLHGRNSLLPYRRG